MYISYDAFLVQLLFASWNIGIEIQRKNYIYLFYDAILRQMGWIGKFVNL